MELARQGYDVLAIDIAAELVTRAKKRIDDLGSAHVLISAWETSELRRYPESYFDASVVMGRCTTWFYRKTASWF